MTDTIRPAHYKGDGMEAMDVINAYGLSTGFNLGNIVKYTLRYTRTGNADDLRKARQYIDFELAAVVDRQAEDMHQRIKDLSR